MSRLASARPRALMVAGIAAAALPLLAGTASAATAHAAGGPAPDALPVAHRVTHVAHGATKSHVAMSSGMAYDLRLLRGCESGGNYAENTGNGYYGAYQFDVGTWRSLGYAGLPSNAAPATQDAAVIRLHAMRGWAPWPSCSARLGL